MCIRDRSVYEGIPHLLTEVVTDMKDASNALRWSVNEMERRYKLMSDVYKRQAQTWLTTIPDSNAQVIASFFIVLP